MPQTLFIIYSTNIPWTTASVQLSSVTQLCLTLCDPMKCRMPSLPVHWRWSWLVHSNPHPLSQWCHPTISIFCHSLFLLPSIFPSIRVFSNESAFRMGWPKYWSFSFNITPSNEHPGLSPLGWTGWISLQCKGLSRVFSNTTVQKHQFFGIQLIYSPALTSIHDYWKNHSLD